LRKSISIVTINLNNKTGLEKTVQSVLGQTYPLVEYIIIDGGSEDGSYEYLQSVKESIHYFISEKDSGIYDAMNKGIRKATGDYILFLNSGDYFNSHDSLFNLIGEDPEASIIFGNMFLEIDGKLTLKKYDKPLNLDYFSRDTLPHPSSLIKRDLFDCYGLYDTSYSIVSDWAFFVDTIVSKKISYQYVDTMVSVFNMNGISSQPGSYKIIKKEMGIHFKKNYPIYYFLSRIQWSINYYPLRMVELVKASFS
jgi:glycosyltransferase involved in cell wall biosynthesis